MSPLTTDDDFFPLAVLLLILLLSFLTILAAKKGFPVPKMGIFERKREERGRIRQFIYLSSHCIRRGREGEGNCSILQGNEEGRKRDIWEAMRSSDLRKKSLQKNRSGGGKGLFSQRESRRFIALPSSSPLKYSHPCLPCNSRSHLRFVCLNVLFFLPSQMMSWGRQRKSRCKRGTRLHRMFLFFARDKTENRIKERRGNLLLLTTHFSPFPFLLL